ncbi:Xaa-Pro peptidase family protein [Pseudonocardia zijingensis]|jgi:Xaa-Pro aminopeptidase|uniref:Xaa-Pro aminopeptidase n=1 Tax=Pseudonocardia zijingensis TaxID=153376 RepID=A0ABP3YJE2_9PSEU
MTELAIPGLADELKDRHRRLLDGLREVGGACLVAIRDESVAYLTGYTTMTWKMHSRPVVAVLTADARLIVVAAETEVDSARLRIPGADVRSYVLLEPPPAPGLPDGPIQFAPHAARVLGEAIEDAGDGPIAVDGLDAVWPPVGQLTRLIPGIADRLVDASALVWKARLRKSPWELDRMRTAAAVLDRAYAAVVDRIRPGMTERQISAQFSIAQLEAGAHEVGPHAAVAHPNRGLFGAPTDRVWDADELLYLDGAAIVDGYWSDYCRTFAVRPPRPEEKAGYARVRAGLEAALAIPPAGRTAAEIGAAMGAAMNIAPEAVGFGRFGHGIGLHVPELPSLHAADPTVIEPGFALCIEPAVLHEGINFVAEEEHVVTIDGYEAISPPAPDGIIVL